LAYPKTVPFESHYLTAEQLAAIAFSTGTNFLLPNTFARASTFDLREFSKA
jgi:hypothetical protein